MALADNVRNAQNAVNYVKSKSILAANKLPDRLKAAGGVDNVVRAGGYDATAAAGVGRTRSAGIVAYTIGNLRGTAEFAARNKFGNCWEQAIMALVYLYDRGIRPLDLMTFSNKAYDHVWTCIGLADGWDPDNLRSWGPEAVWCDPWQGQGVAFAVDDLVKGKVRNLNAIFKCNTTERVEAGIPDSLFHEG
jgi:hypothetical protein